MQPINGVVFVLDGLLIGAGDVRFLAWAMVLAAAVFVPCAWLVLVYDGGIGWLWASLLLLMIVRLVTLGFRWSSGAWAIPGADLARSAPDLPRLPESRPTFELVICAHRSPGGEGSRVEDRVPMPARRELSWC